ncbi:Parkin coregulated gene protein-like [Durusdinium trenchii]|uniref:Parkin coregulated gene protein-like n=1 Tax=Durusdinium trenchii TaxID=1381693 RepID=A0ABP0INW0_9DINO
MQWIRELDENAFQEDVLILAGDIANTMEVLEETLLLLKARFQRIFFCPGSLADWWNTCPVMVWPWGGRRLLKLKPQTDEVGDFGLQLHRKVFALLPALQGVGQIPCNYGGLQIVRRCALDDYWATRWPQKLRIEDGSVAEAFDQLNERCFQNVMQRRDEFQAVVSFSHFVPRIELNPEKRYLIPSSLAKAVGSAYLKERVEKLKPDVHVFGHTHFGYDMELDGIRYLQAPLATPAERVWAGSLVTLGGFPIERKFGTSLAVRRFSRGVRKGEKLGAAGGCIPGAISLPHPAATETLASLDDDVLLQLCERLNAKSGNMIIYAEEDESSWDAALLLAGYFRIWPTAMNLDSSTMCPLARVTSLVLDFSLSS